MKRFSETSVYCRHIHRLVNYVYYCISTGVKLECERCTIHFIVSVTNEKAPLVPSYLKLSLRSL